MSKLSEQILDTTDDEIGSLLARTRAIQTMTREKRGLIACAVEAMRAANAHSVMQPYDKATRLEKGRVWEARCCI
jgi:hypothetical protein